jgi:hypothetical protein
VSGIEVLAVVLVMAFGSAVQASVGFGLSLAAAPILILINPLLVPAPLLVAALVLTILVSYRDRQGIQVTGVGSLMAGRVLGTAPGALLIAVLPLDRTRLVLGLLILAAVGISLVGYRPSQRPLTLFSVGIVSGFMSATSAVGGPPLALVYQHQDGQRLRGTLSFVLTFGTIISLAGLFLAGRFRMTELHLALGLLPGTLLGYLLSGRAAAVLDRGHTRTAVLVMASSAAIMSVVSAFL